MGGNRTVWWIAAVVALAAVAGIYLSLGNSTPAVQVAPTVPEPQMATQKSPIDPPTRKQSPKRTPVAEKAEADEAMERAQQREDQMRAESIRKSPVKIGMLMDEVEDVLGKGVACSEERLHPDGSITVSYAYTHAEPERVVAYRMDAQGIYRVYTTATVLPKGTPYKVSPKILNLGEP
jgi:hypothetical protein